MNFNLTKFQLNQTIDRRNKNKNCLNELNELKFCEVSRNSFSDRYRQFHLSILKNKKVLFLKKYYLCRSLLIGQESSNRWRFAVLIFSESFGFNQLRFHASFWNFIHITFYFYIYNCTGSFKCELLQKKSIINTFCLVYLKKDINSSY